MERHAYFEKFEDCALKTPDKAALISQAINTNTQTLVDSYQDLNRWSNALAKELLNTHTGEYIGIYIDSQAAYIAALLACGKAAKCFVPLDVNLPAKRLTQLITQAQITTVITNTQWQSSLASKLSDEMRKTVLFSERDEAVLADPNNDENPALQVKANSSSYIMFTSGSSGVPKAVVGQHKGLVHFLNWESQCFDVTEKEVVSWLAPTTFDVSLRDILLPLINGATLAIPQENTKMNIQQLLKWTETQAVTHMHCVPSIFRLLTDALGDMPNATIKLPHLRRILLAGEPLHYADVNAWRAAGGGHVELVNLYGPSETTLAKLFHRIEPNENQQGMVPIGKVLPKTQVLIIQGGRACNQGEIGEIYIKTPYRSLGYLNDPQQTSAVFIQNPLQSEQTDIVYKTGDLGRFSDNGEVICLGRLDNQVKINGLRIELGEIEAACRKVKDVAEVVVQAVVNKDSSKLLCCYYVRQDKSKTPLAVNKLRTVLSEYLPETMIPGVYVCLSKLPKLLNGKVNRKALPAPEEVLYANMSYVAPASATEEKLCEIWAECLCLNKVCTATEFYSLGGDSFKMIRVLSAIFKTFGKEISLKQWLLQPTIQAIALLLDKTNENTSTKDIPCSQAADYYPVSTAQKRLWTLYKMGVAPVSYNLPEAYFISGHVDKAALQSAWQALVNRHESLRTVFFEQEQAVFQRILPEVNFEMQYQELPLIDDDILASLIDDNQNHAFDLQSGPLMRVKLIKYPHDDQFILLFNIHHIICDAWSLNILVQELADNYQASLQDKTANHPELKLHFKDFVGWQKQQLNEAQGQASKKWWLKQLAAPLPVLDLPCDYTRPPVQSFNGNTHQQIIPMPIFNKAKELADKQGVSLFVLLNLAVKILLYRYTGQSELVVGSPVVGRAHPDLDGQIGYYANTLPLRDHLDPTLSINLSLHQLNESINMALAHQQFPFDELIEDLEIPRDMGHSPLFDVMLVLQNMDLAMPELAGTQFKAISKEQGWNFSRYDLVFHFQPDEQGLLMDINYNSDIFKSSRIANYAQHLTVLLESMAEQPEQNLDCIEILPEAEKALLKTFSQGKKCAVVDNSMSGLFFEVAKRYPTELALIANKTRLDYQTLASEVIILAKGLISQGVKPGDVVAVLTDRSADSILSLLAIIASGGIYLPVDSEQPESRLITILENSECKLILQPELADYAPAQNSPAPVFRLNEIKSQGMDNDSPLPQLDPQAPAYMIYTSGSTGKPKGVVLKHTGFVNMSLAQIAEFNIEKNDNVLQFASLSFDASLANIFMALYSGATLVLIDKVTIEQPQRFLSFLDNHQISVATLPPAYLRALNRPSLATLKVLITAGEAANIEDAAYYSQKLSYFNAYGPTEASVCASIEKVSDTSFYNNHVTIGKPLANTDILVLGNGSLAPVGVPGELCILGENLALGYRNEQLQTQRAFVDIPAHLTDCTHYTRMYKTGDMVVWNELGHLTFIGRNDKQVKINAFRVDTGEVENALLGLNEVEAAYVDTVDIQGDSKLSAWVVAQRKPEIWPSVAEFYVYDDVLYGSMARDFSRNDVYFSSFKKYLKDKIVLEIGPGPEVVLSQLAIAAGAKKVYAVELLPETYRKACEKVEALGLSEKIIVINSDVQNVILPEKADWCISEIVGSIGGSEGAAKIINNSRHLLHEPANMLPQRSLTAMAAVCLPHEDFYQGFTPIAAHYVNEIFERQGHGFDLRLCIKNLPKNAVISEHGVLEDLDYTQEIPLEAEHHTFLKINRHAKMSGLIFWLQLYVDNENYVDSLYAEKSWLPIYLPLFDDETVDVAPGDQLELTVTRSLCQNGLNPDFEINGYLENNAGERRQIHGHSAHYGKGFNQTPFYQNVFQLPENNGTDLPLSLPTQDILQVNEIRNLLAQHLPNYAIPQFISLVDQFPLTLNGKVDRQQLPKPLEQITTAFVESSTPTESAICRIWQEVLSVEQVGITDNFFSLGGDSISAIQIVAKMSAENMAIDTRDIFQNPVVSQLALTVKDANSIAEQGLVTGLYPLTPIQQWAFENFADKLYWFNQACMLHLPTRIDETHVTQIVTRLISHHDMLRATFVNIDGEIKQQLIERIAPVIECQQWSEYETVDEISALDCDLWHQDFSLDKNLFKVIVLKLKSRDVVLLVANHLLIDTVSWRIVIEDMQTLITDMTQVLPNKTDDFGLWSEHLQSLAKLNSGQLNEPYWQMLIEEQGTLQTANHKPIPEKRIKRTLGNSQNETFLIEREISDGLIDKIKSTNFTLEQLFLTALGHGLQALTGNSYNLVTMENHGRNSISGVRSNVNVSRTLGWFTSYYPMPLSVFDHVGETLTRTQIVKDKLPDNGMAYLLLRWLRSNGDKYDLKPQVSFNYLGEFNALATDSDEQAVRFDFDVPGRHQHPDIPCEHNLDWLMMFEQGRLSVTVSYGIYDYSEQDITNLKSEFIASLANLNDYLSIYSEQRSETGQFTVEGLTDTEFDNLF